MDNNNILQKLEGLESRYEEVSTLITDPDVIADQPRYVKPVSYTHLTLPTTPYV